MIYIIIIWNIFDGKYKTIKFFLDRYLSILKHHFGKKFADSFYRGSIPYISRNPNGENEAKICVHHFKGDIKLLIITVHINTLIEMKKRWKVKNVLLMWKLEIPEVLNIPYYIVLKMNYKNEYKIFVRNFGEHFYYFIINILEIIGI